MDDDDQVWAFTATTEHAHVLITEFLDSNGERVRFTVATRQKPYDTWGPPVELMPV